MSSKCFPRPSSTLLQALQMALFFSDQWTMKNKKNILFISELGLRKLARHWGSSHKTPLDTGRGHIHDSYV